MKFGVIVFPGSNCDDDMLHVIGSVMGQQVEKIWHKETSLGSYEKEDCIILPGGFSYGDYVRAGAIAHLSPIMQAVVDFANKGGLVWGICNGFQVLCEAHLLPGALLRNQQQRFCAKNVFIKPATKNSPITRRLSDEALLIPIAHAEGRYYADTDTISRLEDNEQVLFRYCDAAGNTDEAYNPNGSVNHIAGICNAQRNVMGMMPHPERASEDILGNADGRRLFESLLNMQSV